MTAIRTTAPPRIESPPLRERRTGARTVAGAELMSVTQAANEAKVTRKAIHDAIETGKLKAVLVGNEFFVIYRKDFEAWQNARKRGRPPKSEG